MSLYYPQAALVLTIEWENFQKSSTSLTTRTQLSVYAKEVSVELNNYNEADKFRASLDYKTFPFDPRTIRSMIVFVHMENVKSVFDEQGQRVEIVPSDDNLVFSGFADESRISLDDTNRTVEIEGRDYTSLFLDEKRKIPEPIDTNKNILELITDLKNEQKATENLVVVNETGETLPKLSAGGPNFDPSTTKKNKKKGENYWEIIQRLAALSAVIVYMRKDQIVIRTPKNLYRERKASMMVYGYNVAKLEFKRKIGRRKAQNVRVYSTHYEQKDKRAVMIPRDATDPDFIKKFTASPIKTIEYDEKGKKVGEKLGEVINFPIPGMVKRERLIKIGEGIFETVSRQHLEGGLETKDMAFTERQGVFRGSDLTFTNADSDRVISFSEIGMGSYIQVVLDQQDSERISSLSDINDRTKYLLSRGYPIEIADAFANSLSKVKYTFIVKSVAYRITDTDGFSMAIDFINIIDSENRALGRSEQFLSAGPAGGT